MTHETRHSCLHKKMLYIIYNDLSVSPLFRVKAQRSFAMSSVFHIICLTGIAFLPFNPGIKMITF